MRNLYFCAFLLIISACGRSGGSIDQEAVREEIAEHEIKRVLPGEVIEAAYERGASISDQLIDHIPVSEGVSSVTAFSDIVSGRLTSTLDSLEKQVQTNIYWRTPQDTANNQAIPLEHQLLKAYLYNVNQKMPVNENVQAIDQEEYLYTRPVFLNIQTGQIAGKNAIASDSVIFVGMWSMQLSKRNIIRHL